MTLSVLWYSLVFLTFPSQLKLPSLLKNTRQPASAQLVDKNVNDPPGKLHQWGRIVIFKVKTFLISLISTLIFPVWNIRER